MATGTIKIGGSMQFTSPLPSGVYSIEGFTRNGIAVVRITLNARSSGWFADVDVGFPLEYVPPLELATIGMPSSSVDASKISYGYLLANGTFTFYLTQSTVNTVRYTFVYPV